jgi:hypothetical protein
MSTTERDADSGSGIAATDSARVGEASGDPEALAVQPSDERPTAAPGLRPHDVLVLGAGASLGARLGIADPPPPLGRRLARYLLDWIDANDPSRPDVQPWPMGAPTEDQRIVGHGFYQNRRRVADMRAALGDVAAKDAQSDEQNFENLMARWSASTKHRDDLEFTQMLLVYAMNFGHGCAFQSGRDRFDDLLNLFNPSVIITVNYDQLIEQALQRRSMRYSFPKIPAPAAGDTFRELGSEGDGPAIPLFKLHGSAGWLAVKGGAGGADQRMVEVQAAVNPVAYRMNRRPKDDDPGVLYSQDTKHTFTPPNGGTLRIELEQGYDPVVAIYGPGKPLLRNLAHVLAHRQACVDLLADGPVGRVLVVGVRPVTVEDDRTLHDLIQQLGALPVEKIYVSPTDEHCGWFEARGFTTVCKGLAEYLVSLPVR